MDLYEKLAIAEKRGKELEKQKEIAMAFCEQRTTCQCHEQYYFPSEWHSRSIVPHKSREDCVRHLTSQVKRRLSNSKKSTIPLFWYDGYSFFYTDDVCNEVVNYFKSVGFYKAIYTENMYPAIHLQPVWYNYYFKQKPFVDILLLLISLLIVAWCFMNVSDFKAPTLCSDNVFGIVGMLIFGLSLICLPYVVTQFNDRYKKYKYTHPLIDRDYENVTIL